ncbi:MAG: 4-hydroxythreonine-4-phosphate dehydrogenase PdxA [Bacteroidetes bacterium]|nr:MAG: 4-hydroxythreonine-4-phosphate dehydrogenase PdxA [Bacteroidota bacterium]MBL1143582.1 4-hydroxythreonine-4-phosphate dehydrogenase PdxA [Bacteroidota bacterium]MCB0803242.1 4-hydroxythreonine-4-phosphate dehydrogenase PdxA [Flavobacteriales bacterium]NOG56384.1 4-hydroxythreonine-4-phosphate dehydrogenase PdxA [Bacteroidota bacterium]
MIARKSSKIRIGISLGDLNGIGPEVILKTLEDNRINDLCIPIIYASTKTINYYLKSLGIQNFNFDLIKDATQFKTKNACLINLWDEEVNINPGQEDLISGKYAAISLKAAAKDLKEGHIDALVTGPINKHSIQSDEFNFPGHTEFLQNLDEAEDSLMLMLSEHARIGVITGHIPVKDISKNINSDVILKKISILNKSLKEDFQIRRPKIAVLGLNPHAGDNGLLGDEEKNIIEPAINQAKSIDILAFGPYPADGFFGSDNYRNYDGILAMYHDQGLIPAKSFSFGAGVNFTSGLSFIRTSPDHGTAYSIAGQGIANEGSFRKAIYTAIEIAKNRLLKAELEQDALPINKNRS